ncbi:hypothetical protein [Kitasatospora phosalacinea]|uniref:hypothetical protein n=1 Tax=Kitasatospora phosalacinea TaxID=2065 RepID=UPI0005240848|nr:hypothetical protein [Kitasatospora phosalacinea]
MPVGVGIVAIRVPAALGRVALRVLDEQQPPVAVGPVILNHLLKAVEFIVPASPALWPGSDIVRLDGRLDSTRTVRVPPLGCRGSGREWLRTPRAAAGKRPILTDPHHLAHALTTARSKFPAGSPIR